LIKSIFSCCYGLLLVLRIVSFDLDVDIYRC